MCARTKIVNPQQATSIKNTLVFWSTWVCGYIMPRRKDISPHIKKEIGNVYQYGKGYIFKLLKIHHCVIRKTNGELYK